MPLVAKKPPERFGSSSPMSFEKNKTFMSPGSQLSISSSNSFRSKTLGSADIKLYKIGLSIAGAEQSIKHAKVTIKKCQNEVELLEKQLGFYGNLQMLSGGVAGSVGMLLTVLDLDQKGNSKIELLMILAFGALGVYFNFKADDVKKNIAKRTEAIADMNKAYNESTELLENFQSKLHNILNKLKLTAVNLDFCTKIDKYDTQFLGLAKHGGYDSDDDFN
jgi:hypothetical protein